eukprot:TRINITY_DN38784_c0_g1_i1.p1 TRINITY_DN38784_c0_g1~~TRINITY_DN38784_c0_g1_i1.p1  ORF type:complete len:404 (+),score=22.22 TRINITY_DN38784_c0_g1_i1:62-1273(+)
MQAIPWTSSTTSGGMGGWNRYTSFFRCISGLLLAGILLSFLLMMTLWSNPQLPETHASHLRFRAISHPSAAELRPVYCTQEAPCRLSMVADLDAKSREDDSSSHGEMRVENTLRFASYMQDAYLFQSDSEHKRLEYFLNFTGRKQRLEGLLNEGGRGMELSELVAYKGSVFTFDDRTGIVYRFCHGGPFVSDEEPILCAYSIFNEGSGDTTAKGMKIEWATRKDGGLVIGSLGKEYTGSNGEFLHDNNMWVVVIGANGSIKRLNWKPFFLAIRQALKLPPKGYCIHEAINWSDILQRWVILPRRISEEAYDDNKGSNRLLLADEQFRHIEVVQVGKVIPERGFSSFSFVPGTGDRILVALKSVEKSKNQFQTSFATVFSIDGSILMEDVEVPGTLKYEGIEFV